MLSAGTQVEKSRFDFQAAYMLRGRVDNVYDLTMNELSKLPIVDDLSRILGVAPGKRGTIIPDRILGLTDADPDGYAIRAGIVTIMACAFPQVIEEGRLFMVEPPLFSFKDNGKLKFVPDNRSYLTYLQKGFAKQHDLYRMGKKMDNDQIFDFLCRNERYLEYLKNVADNNICSMEFTELIISNLNKFGIDKKSVKDWNKLVHKEFSPQLNAEWSDGRIIISGIKNGRYEMIELDEDLIGSKKTRKLLDIMNNNLNVVYGYGIDQSNNDTMSISSILNAFGKYKGKDLHRYKGLGEMDAKDLRDTCMDLKNQKAVKITSKDIDKAIKDLAFWHSKKQDARDSRREFMMKYIPDIQDIST